MKWRRIVKSDGSILVPRAQWADGLMGHFVGLMFRPRLPVDEAIVLAYSRESQVETAIHMFFMFFPIAALFLDRDGVVVHKVLARPWRPFYASPRPAQYVVEAHPAVLECVAIGDRLAFEQHEA